MVTRKRLMACCLMAIAVLLIGIDTWSMERPYRNRGIANITFEPGNSSGTVKTRIEWFAESDTTSFDLNFGTIIDIEVNGEAADWLHVPVVFSPYVTIPNWCPVHEAPIPGDDCLSPCYLYRCGTIMVGEPVQEVLGDCDCRHYELGMGIISECMCTGHLFAYSHEFTMQPGAQVRVSLTPASGSILEEYTLDDTLTVTYTSIIPATSPMGLIILVTAMIIIAFFYLIKRRNFIRT
jgi:hypothetical protein